MDATSLLMLFAFGGASFGAAATGAIFRPGEWYRQLDKPRWRPPDWLFAPVWTLLYVMIALSGWLVWREKGLAGAAVPLTAYAVQLALNAAWTRSFSGCGGRPSRRSRSRCSGRRSSRRFSFSIRSVRSRPVCSYRIWLG
jgi:tryptophan-rich sensory protein